MTMLVSPGSGLSHITATARVTERRSHQPTLDIVIPAHGESWSREEFQIFVRYVKKVGVSLVLRERIYTHLWFIKLQAGLHNVTF